MHCLIILHTVMVFSKSRASLSLTELKARTKIITQDFKRLNKGNSSIIRASIGKTLRTYSWLGGKMRDTIFAARILHYDAKNLLRSRIDEKQQNENHKSFFPICFTCKRHFEFLRIALYTLGIQAPPVKEVNIFIDKADPFDTSQCKLLRSELRYPLIFHQTVFPMSWAGAQVILNELDGFRQLVTQIKTQDFLVKFDSDVIFLSDAIFHFVASCEAGAVGTAISHLHPSNYVYDYFQGGCYFISGANLRAMLDLPITGTALGLWSKCSNLPEDHFMCELLRKCSTKIAYEHFLHSDSFIEEPALDEKGLQSQLRRIPSTASVLHFEGKKINMRRIAERLFPSLPPVYKRN